MAQTQHPTHICVAVDGSHMSRDAYATLLNYQLKPFPHATVRLRPGEKPEDAAWRHHQAEVAYFNRLSL